MIIHFVISGVLMLAHHYDAGFTTRQIASQLGVSQGLVNRELQRAKIGSMSKNGQPNPSKRVATSPKNVKVEKPDSTKPKPVRVAPPKPGLAGVKGVAPKPAPIRKTTPR